MLLQSVGLLKARLASRSRSAEVGIGVGFGVGTGGTDGASGGDAGVGVGDLDWSPPCGCCSRLSRHFFYS